MQDTVEWKVTGAGMDQIRVAESRWRDADAWVLTGRELEVVVTKIGGHIASVTTPGDDLNPLWQPPWPAAAPAEAASQPEVYGEGPEAPLLAAIVGHNLCLDRFGPSWPGESRPVHGEAGVVAWRFDGRSTADRIVLDADLPEAVLRVSRSFEMDGDALSLTTRVSHSGDAPRGIEWAEHVTLGDPFLDGAHFSVAADGAWIWGGEPRDRWRFSDADAEAPVPPDAALAMPPASTGEPYGDIVTIRLVHGEFRAERRDLGRALEYRWDVDEFPWLCLWTQHRSRTAKPWNGVTRARGMEFSTKPYPEGKPPSERATTYQGRPTTCSVPPGAGLERSCRIRWTTI